MSAPRPRVRVLHADPDKAPVLVIDRWTAETASFVQDDIRSAGFSGVLVFSQDIDLDDDGLDEAPPVDGPVSDVVARELRWLERAARDVARSPLGGTSADAVRTALDRLDAARLDAARRLG